mmetsp:Transcript_168030/g.539540  ORF Transcript_168030/g.539540 Transcript_168030/m.539540 type:complete len:207 (-) Transcript_168030:77-697(-)
MGRHGHTCEINERALRQGMVHLLDRLDIVIHLHHLIAQHATNIRHGASDIHLFRTARQLERRQREAVPEREERLAGVVPVCSANTRCHVVVRHGALLDEIMWVHRDRKLAPTVLQAEEAGSDGFPTHHRRIEGLNDRIRRLHTWCDELVYGQGTTIRQNKHRRLPERENFEGKSLLQSWQSCITAIEPFVLDSLVVAQHQHHNISS